MVKYPWGAIEMVKNQTKNLLTSYSVRFIITIVLSTYLGTSGHLKVLNLESVWGNLNIFIISNIISLLFNLALSNKNLNIFDIVRIDYLINILVYTVSLMIIGKGLPIGMLILSGVTMSVIFCLIFEVLLIIPGLFISIVNEKEITISL